MITQLLYALRFLASKLMGGSSAPVVNVTVNVPSQSHTEVIERTFNYRQSQRRYKQRMQRRVQINKGIM